MPPPSYRGLKPASDKASAIARAGSKKQDTRCELLLRRAVWARGLRYRLSSRALPGRPDLVFSRARVVVFCDGDFWHGRDLAERLRRLGAGHNSAYWIEKIKSNVERDERHRATLEEDGWLLLRFWESDILRNADAIADDVVANVRRRLAPKT